MTKPVRKPNKRPPSDLQAARAAQKVFERVFESEPQFTVRNTACSPHVRITNERETVFARYWF
jgi:hypothetical protein